MSVSVCVFKHRIMSVRVSPDNFLGVCVTVCVCLFSELEFVLCGACSPQPV